jgi:hypothetical protein
MPPLKTVYEQAVETGEKTFPLIWAAIRQAVEDGADEDAILDALCAALQRRRPNRQFWNWVEDAIAAARHLSAIEADRRRRKFRLVKGEKAE